MDGGRTMILVAGTPTERPVELMLERAAEHGSEVVVLDETRAEDWRLEVAVGPAGVTARARVTGTEIHLGRASGLYLRLSAPRITGEVPDPLRDARRRAAVALLSAWSDVAPIRVANRPRHMASNGSKPYQAELIRALGFSVPATLVTNDPDEVLAFRRRHGRIVYKSASGVRSIVRELGPPPIEELGRVRNQPTQFQQLLEGCNVRVHVVGPDVHACRIDAATLDYRYAEGHERPSMHAVRLPEPIRQGCLRLYAELGLPFAGIDLLQDPDGRWWCFEVNPSPAYSAFEHPAGLPVARSLVAWLAASGSAPGTRRAPSGDEG